MEGEAPPPPKKAKNGGIKKKQQLGDIVFTGKHGAIQTMPSLEKRLKTVTDPVIGLQFVWEYRSPTKSVPPHYLCRLCKVQRLQNEMSAHITGWKHCFKYLKKHHPDKVPQEEEAAVKDPAIRRAVKESAAEVEKTEGRGKLKVVLKEPFEVPYFQAMPSAKVKTKMGMPGLDARFPRGFPDGMVPGEFPPCGMRPDFPMGMPMRRFPADMPMNSGGGFSDGMPIPRNNGAGRPFPGGMSMRMPGDDMGMKMRDADMDLRRFPDNRPMGMGGDNFGMGPNPGRRFPDDFSGGQLGGSNDRMMPGMQKGPEGNSLPDTLLKYLDTFRIENENDAQIVLKVTQKLTDVLMEYRLRNVSSGSSLKNTSSMNSMGSLNSMGSMSSMNSMNSMNFGSRSGGDRFSGNLSGSSRFFN